MAPRLYVGRLNYRVRDRDLEDLFRSCGRIREILVKNGYAFVELDSTRAAQDAIDRLHKTYFMGDRIIVEFAKDRPYFPGRQDRYNSPRRRSRSTERGYTRRRRSYSRSPLRVSNRRPSHSPSASSTSRDRRSRRAGTSHRIRDETKTSREARSRSSTPKALDSRSRSQSVILKTQDSCSRTRNIDTRNRSQSPFSQTKHSSRSRSASCTYKQGPHTPSGSPPQYSDKNEVEVFASMKLAHIPSSTNGLDDRHAKF